MVKIKRYVIETTYINDYGEKLVLVKNRSVGMYSYHEENLIGIDVKPYDYKWLIEQAERVEELEQQNKRYREAIEKIKKKISKQLEGLDAEEEMQRVMELSELMTMAVGSLKEENFNLTQTAEQLDLFGEESE